MFEIAIEHGARYDNPARFIKRASERPKRLGLPSPDQFNRFVASIEQSGSGFSKPCADLVRFLAFGGFRKSDAELRHKLADAFNFAGLRRCDGKPFKDFNDLSAIHADDFEANRNLWHLLPDALPC